MAPAPVPADPPALPVDPEAPPVVYEPRPQRLFEDLSIAVTLLVLFAVGMEYVFYPRAK